MAVLDMVEKVRAAWRRGLRLRGHMWRRGSVPFLGVQTDRRLKWDDHISAVTPVRQFASCWGYRVGLVGC